jgi:hypothetical protein
MESAHRAGTQAMAHRPSKARRFVGKRGHRFREHGDRPARVDGFSERSGRVISTCESGFRERIWATVSQDGDFYDVSVLVAFPGPSSCEKACTVILCACANC